MPELPEVETIVSRYRPWLEGRRICSFTSSWAKNARPSPAAVRGALVGKTIRRLARRGKFIVFHLNDGGCLLVHLRMSGRLEWATGSSGHQPAPAAGPDGDRRHVRASWELDDGARLLLCDARKFGRIIYAPDFAKVSACLGPEPLDRSFRPKVLAGLLRRRRRQLKPLLLDQSVIAGLGNIYTDEVLHRAGLHPRMSSDQVSEAQARQLHRAIRQVLRLAIRRGGTSFDRVYAGGGMQQHLRVYGRAGRPCRCCGTTIVRLRIGQRGTHICPRCQPLRGGG